MPLYRRKPVIIEAITFDELVCHGRAEYVREGREMPYEMPGAFSYKGHPISHENDHCYVIPTLEGVAYLTPSDMLITGVDGEIYPCKRDMFLKTYEPVSAPDTADHQPGQPAPGATDAPSH